MSNAATALEIAAQWQPINYEDKEMEWHNYIADHIQHTAYRTPELYGERGQEAFSEIIDACVTLVTESERIGLIIITALSDKDDAGFDLAKLMEREIEGYCERHQDELKSKFPEEFEDFKAIDSGDEVDV